MVSPGASSFGPSSGSAQPDALQRWLTTGALIGAAALVGFGIIVWIAANWDDFGRFGRFTLVGSAILASSVAAATVPAARVPGSLAGMLGIGGLLALVGQTYQTGADPWQLFALWAGLSLPWAIAARHDAVWCLWVVVVFTALPLWMLAQTDRLWRLAMDVALPAWLAGIAVVAVLCPNFALERWLGRTHWSFRLAAALALVLVTSGALGNLFNSNGAHPVYWAGLMLTAAAAAAFAVSAPFDLALLAAATLALDVLLIGGAVRAILDGSSGANEVGRLLSIGLFSCTSRAKTSSIASVSRRCA